MMGPASIFDVAPSDAEDRYSRWPDRAWDRSRTERDDDNRRGIHRHSDRALSNHWCQVGKQARGGSVQLAHG